MWGDRTPNPRLEPSCEVFLSALYVTLMDPASNNTYRYMLTLTSSIGFNASQEDQVVQWHRHNSDKCFLVSELHDSGGKHYHSVIACVSPRTAGKVTEKLVRLYSQMRIDVVKGISVCVKSVSDFVGCLHYLCKDLDDAPLLLIGWRMSWIKSECLANVKHIPHKMLRADQYMVQSSTSVQLVLRYAHASGHPLCGKDSFMTVVVEMQSTGYQFEKIKPRWLYAQVMAMVGRSSIARSLWDDVLCGLD